MFQTFFDSKLNFLSNNRNSAAMKILIWILMLLFSAVTRKKLEIGKVHLVDLASNSIVKPRDARIFGIISRYSRSHLM